MYYAPHTRDQDRKAFPVRDDFFAPVRLSASRLRELREEANVALQSALQSMAQYRANREDYLVDSPPWRPHVEYQTLTEFKRPHPTLPTGSISHLFGRVEGNFRDYLRFFHSTTNHEYMTVQKRLFNFTVDARVLYNVPEFDEQAAAASDAYEAVKWVAYEPFSLRFRLDACHYESTGTAMDANGHTFGYRILLPLTLKEVPDLQKTKRSVRTSIKSVMLVLPMGHAQTTSELFMTMEADFKSNVVPRSYYKRFMMSLFRVAEFRHAHKLHAQDVCTTRAWIPDDMRPNCAVCTRGFSILRSKHHCHVCGEVVCRRCLVARAESALATAEDAKRRQKVRVCTTCIRLLREDHLHEQSTPVPIRSAEDTPAPLTARAADDGARGQAKRQWRASRAQSSTWTDHRYSETTTENSSHLSSSVMSSSSSSYMRLVRSDSFCQSDVAESPRIGDGFMTVDTSEMTPLRLIASSEILEDIDRSLAEQEHLLRQLKRHASGVRG